MTSKRSKPSKHTPLPKARRDNILVTEVENEVLLYDVSEKRAHALNPTAALVWQRCDGETTVADLAARLEARGIIPGEQAIALALQQLGKAGLVENDRSAGVSRREFARRVGRVGLAVGAAPVIASVVAPTAMAASSATCANVGLPCNSDSDCGIPANLCHCTTSRNNPNGICVPK